MNDRRVDHFAAGQNSHRIVIPMSKTLVDYYTRNPDLSHREGLDRSSSSHLIVGMVPTNLLTKYQEYDRAQTPGYPGQEGVKQAVQWMSQPGAEHRDPLHLGYDHRHKWGYLGEGNHRLAAARHLGVTHLPVVVHRVEGLGEVKTRGVGAPLHIDETKTVDNFYPKEIREDSQAASRFPYISPENHPNLFHELRG